MYSELLLPTDGSDATTVAVEHGVAIADRVNSTVRFLHGWMEEPKRPHPEEATP